MTTDNAIILRNVHVTKGKYSVFSSNNIMTITCIMVQLAAIVAKVIKRE